MSDEYDEAAASIGITRTQLKTRFFGFLYGARGTGIERLMKRHVDVGTGVLCGDSLTGIAIPRWVSWMSRDQTDCDRCRVLVALAEANGLAPWASEPSLRQALAELLRKIG